MEQTEGVREAQSRRRPAGAAPDASGRLDALAAVAQGAAGNAVDWRSAEAQALARALAAWRPPHAQDGG